MAYQRRHLEEVSVPVNSRASSIVAGAIAGLAASWAMNRLMLAVREAAGTRSSEERGWNRLNVGRRRRKRSSIRGVRSVARKIFKARMSGEETKLSGPAIQYAFGTAMGAAYGALADRSNLATAAMGIPYGTLVWLGADEIALPLLDLGASPFHESIGTHARGLAAHAVYGFTLDVTRRAVMGVMPKGTGKALHEFFTLEETDIRRGIA